MFTGEGRFESRTKILHPNEYIHSKTLRIKRQHSGVRRRYLINPNRQRTDPIWYRQLGFVMVAFEAFKSSLRQINLVKPTHDWPAETYKDPSQARLNTTSFGTVSCGLEVHGHWKWEAPVLPNGNPIPQALPLITESIASTQRNFTVLAYCAALGSETGMRIASR